MVVVLEQPEMVMVLHALSDYLMLDETVILALYGHVLSELQRVDLILIMILEGFDLLLFVCAIGDVCSRQVVFDLCSRWVYIMLLTFHVAHMGVVFRPFNQLWIYSQFLSWSS